MFKKFCYCFLFTLLFIQTSFASKVPTLPISYDSSGTSARSLAMGKTGVALPANTESVFYNSASIAYNTTEQIQAEMLVYFAKKTNLSNEQIFVNDPINLGLESITLSQNHGSISWRTLSSYEIEYNDGTTSYKKQEHIKAISISTANFNEKDYSVGLSLSYLYGTLSETLLEPTNAFAQTSSGNGFSIDLGYLQHISNNIYFGLNLENILGFMWWEHYNYDQLPFGIRTGLSYIKNYSTILFDWNKKFYRFGNYEDTFYALGIEQYICNFLCIRLGVNTSSISNQEKLKYTYGLGLNVAMFNLSFAGQYYKLQEEYISKYILSLKVTI